MSTDFALHPSVIEALGFFALVWDEPVEGSVVMTQGATGTAWQRHFSDGLWHSTTGRTATWQDLKAHSLLAVYIPKEI